MTFINLKSLVKVVALFVMVTFSSTTLLATEINPVVNLKKGIEKSFALYMDYQTAKDFEITLKDKASQVLFQEKVENTKQFAKQFNLAKLPDGIYFLSIEDHMSIYTQVIQIAGKELAIDNTKESTVYKPTVFQKGDKVFLSAMILDAEDAEVVVYGKDHEVIYSEKFDNQAKIEKVFSFAGKNPEDHAISIRYKGHAFYFDAFKSLAKLNQDKFAVKR